MQVVERLSEGLKREYRFLSDEDEIEGRVEARYKELRSTLKIRGFRSGRVPRSLIVRKYGEQVRREVLNQFVQDAIKKHWETTGERPVGEPESRVLEEADGEACDFGFELAYECYPAVPKVAYELIAVERPVAQITEDDVDSQLEIIAASNRERVRQPPGYKALLGDVVEVSLPHAPRPGEKTPKEVRHHLVVGEGDETSFQTLEFLGAEVGSLITLTPTNDPQSGHERPSDQKKLEFLVTDIFVLSPPAVDQGLAERLGASSLEELRRHVLNEARTQAELMSWSVLSLNLTIEINRIVDVEVPRKLLDHDLKQIRAVFRHAKSLTMNDERLDDASEAFLEGHAVRRVKATLVYHDVVRRHNLEIGHEEIRRELLAQAQNATELRVLEQRMSTDAVFRGTVQNSAVERRAVGYLAELVDVTVRDVTMTALTSEFNRRVVDGGLELGVSEDDSDQSVSNELPAPDATDNGDTATFDVRSHF